MYYSLYIRSMDSFLKLPYWPSYTANTWNLQHSLHKSDLAELKYFITPISSSLCHFLTINVIITKFSGYTFKMIDSSSIPKFWVYVYHVDCIPKFWISVYDDWLCILILGTRLRWLSLYRNSEYKFNTLTPIPKFWVHPHIITLVSGFRLIMFLIIRCLVRNQLESVLKLLLKVFQK